MKKTIRIEEDGAAVGRRLRAESGALGEDIAQLGRELDRAIARVGHLLATLENSSDPN